MTQHQQPHKFTSLPQTILILYLHVYLQVARSAHLDHAARNTNLSDQGPQQIHVLTRNYSTNSNDNYSTRKVKLAATNTQLPTSQQKKVPLNSPLECWRPQYPNPLCRKSKRKQPQDTAKRPYSIREEGRMQRTETERRRSARTGSRPQLQPEETQKAGACRNCTSTLASTNLHSASPSLEATHKTTKTSDITRTPKHNRSRND